MNWELSRSERANNGLQHRNLENVGPGSYDPVKYPSKKPLTTTINRSGMVQS